MARDHFVAQTYLRFFTDIDGHLNAYKKSGKPSFRPLPSSICAESDGDTNPLFSNQNILGDIRKTFEDTWKVTIQKIINNEPLVYEDKFRMAGLIANLINCTPVSKSFGKKLYLDSLLDLALNAETSVSRDSTTAETLRKGLELLKNGTFSLNTDDDYIKGLQTVNLFEVACILYNQEWILCRNTTDIPFLTSDNPCAIYPLGNKPFQSLRVLPITPNLCIFINFTPTTFEPVNFKFDEPFVLPKPFKWIKVIDGGNRAVMHINRAVILNAGELIFCSKSCIKLDCYLSRYSNQRIVLLERANQVVRSPIPVS